VHVFDQLTDFLVAKLIFDKIVGPLYTGCVQCMLQISKIFLRHMEYAGTDLEFNNGGLAIHNLTF